MRTFGKAAIFAGGLCVAGSGFAHAANSLTSPAPVSSWTGFYVGGNAGYVWSNTDITWTTDGTNVGTAITDAATGTIASSGFTGGAQLGYNFQSGRFVYGVETDFNYTGISGARDSVPVGFVNRMRTTVESKWLWTVRGRLGTTVDKALLYVTGGLAVAQVKVYDQLGTTTLFTNSSDTARVGWTLGGGVEWAFNPAWSVKAEYLYVNLGNVSYNNLCSPAGVCDQGLTLDHKLTEHLLRAGINYHFASH